jgi:hypothetical protein
MGVGQRPTAMEAAINFLLEFRLHIDDPTDRDKSYMSRLRRILDGRRDDHQPGHYLAYVVERYEQYACRKYGEKLCTKVAFKYNWTAHHTYILSVDWSFNNFRLLPQVSVLTLHSH